MKREKTLTKRERKAQRPLRPGARPPEGQHIHCIACGRHLDPQEFEAPVRAMMLRCKHGSTFPSCAACAPQSRALLEEHDRTGQEVRTAGAWH